MMGRQTFLAHFIIVLACAGASFFAWQRGIPQLVWANDVAGWFGLAIGAVTISAMLWLGWQAWRIDHADASYGHLVSLLCPAIGMLGTVVGLSLSLSKVGDPVQMIASAHTAFYSTGAGIVGMIVVMLMTHSLEVGIKRARP